MCLLTHSWKHGPLGYAWKHGYGANWTLKKHGHKAEKNTENADTGLRRTLRTQPRGWEHLEHGHEIENAQNTVNRLRTRIWGWEQHWEHCHEAKNNTKNTATRPRRTLRTRLRGEFITYLMRLLSFPMIFFFFTAMRLRRTPRTQLRG